MAEQDNSLLSKIGKVASPMAGVLQAGIGIWDRIKGNKKLEEAQSFWEKNKFQIPESAKSALGLAERQAQTFRLPGEDIARAEIGATTASGVGEAKDVATSSSDVLNVLSSLYGGEQQQQRDLAMTGAQRYDQNQAILAQELGRMAGWENERWTQNVAYPLNRMLGQAEAYQSRGAQGIGMGLNALTGAASDMMQLNSAENQYADFMDRSVYSLGNNQPTTLVGAQALNRVSRQNLPSYSYNYVDPLRTRLNDIPLSNR